MKKTLLSIGTIVSTIAPVASVIACGDGDVPGHEAPYSITIQADATKPTQANVFLDLKGFVTDSYIKEIKSRIAESIAAANKDTLKYSTIKIYIGDKSNLNYEENAYKLLIDSSPLIDTNKNNLDVVFNLIDTPFDNFMKQLKTEKFFNQFFQENIWQNKHDQIDKVDKDEIRRNLLRLFGYDDSNPDVIDFTYKIISEKFIDFTITRTNVVANPELRSTGFANAATSHFDFIAGESLKIKMIFNDNLEFDARVDCEPIYLSKTNSNSKILQVGSGVPQNFMTQLYKIADFLLKSNGYNKQVTHIVNMKEASAPEANMLESLGNSKSRIFGYGDNGQKAGINFKASNYINTRKVKIDFDKKTFNIKSSANAYNEKQWIFGIDGHLVIEPSKKWTLEFEGTYEINDAGNAVETIPSLTKAIATDGTHTIHLLESSAKLLSKYFINDLNYLIDK